MERGNTDREEAKGEGWEGRGGIHHRGDSHRITTMVLMYYKMQS